MGLKIFSVLALHCWVFLALSFRVRSQVAVQLLSTPLALSNRNSASFAFRVLLGGNDTSGVVCTDCSTNCKLDYGTYSACEDGRVSYTGLLDGNHSFEVCTNGSSGVACATHNWTIDTVQPTAYIATETTFTSASHVSVNISFSEPCGGGGGFRCSSSNSCNLLVYGSGDVIPNTLNVIQQNLKYSIVISVSERVRYGRLILVMDKSFCTDSAGNLFTRTENSSLFIRFDRRTVFANMRTHIPERLLQINTDTRTILATNKNRDLLVYLYFTEPVVNSTEEVFNSLNTSQGTLVPISGNSLGQRRFGYQLTNIPEMAIVTVSLHSDLVLSRQGTTVASVAPITFLYDTLRPTVKLSTTCNMRTKEKSIVVLIKFVKPVFDFNSSHVSVSGGQLESFHEMSRSSYVAQIQANTGTIFVSIPENITTDVSGNRNQPSNTVQVRHYSVPVESKVVSLFTTVVFALTSLVVGFLTISTTSLLSIGAFTRPSSIFIIHPARSLFRFASHIQFFALSSWLAVTWPVEYYELARGLHWSIPYFNLPWEKERNNLVMWGSSSPKNRMLHNPQEHNLVFFKGVGPDAGSPAAKVFGLPLSPVEYRSYFESHNILPEAEYISDPQNSHGWRDFSRSMFWLAVISGSLMVLHILLIMILKFKKKNKETWSYKALVFPRFEIFLIILALPCFCEASSSLIRGGTSSGTAIGVLMLSLVALLLLSLLFFLSYGITLGKLLQYKEIHQVGKKYHWYQELIRVTLGPGKRGQWTWKTKPNASYLTILGPLFEDLRGPPKYMLTQISGSSLNKRGDSIIPSDDETEDAEAPCIQKLFGILRIYYTLLDCAKRVALGIVAGAYSDSWSKKNPIIALLCITSFQLFFMVLKKPFIQKKVQLAEIISVSCEVIIFAFCVVLLEKDISAGEERKIGISMISVFLLSFIAQMMNEWYAIYRQIQQLDPIKNNFLRGLRTALVGFIIFFCPHCLVKSLEKGFPVDNSSETGDVTSTVDRNRSSGSGNSNEKPWLRQISELARSSFGREGSKGNDPSTSKNSWSGFWKAKRSTGSSSASTSIDIKSKSRGLHKELEDIFASKS